FTMINPINHAKSPDEIAVYKTEPYVLASDVYALAPHTGRGGWMYQFILESLLGLRLEADKLHFSPCVPADWNSFQVHYRYRKTVYHITVVQASVAGGGPRLTVDGVELTGPAIPLVDDRRQHAVEVRIHAARR
ncbi:MAG: glycosyl hydrolase family 65 protein, partial [Sphingomicrobium sp.]